jgi:hypothetical protein
LRPRANVAREGLVIRSPVFCSRICEQFFVVSVLLDLASQQIVRDEQNEHDDYFGPAGLKGRAKDGIETRDRTFRSFTGHIAVIKDYNPVKELETMNRKLLAIAAYGSCRRQDDCPRPRVISRAGAWRGRCVGCIARSRALPRERFSPVAHRVISQRRGIWSLPSIADIGQARTNQARFMSTRPSWPSCTMRRPRLNRSVMHSGCRCQEMPCYSPRRS